MRNFRKLTGVLGGLLAATAGVSTIAAQAEAAVTQQKDPTTATPESLAPQRIEVRQDNEGPTPFKLPPQVFGPGVHRFSQRPLTGLEIRAVRKQSRAFPTNRMARSKYMPNGISARAIKVARYLATRLQKSDLALKPAA